MINEALNYRLEGILDILIGTHKSGSGSSSATKGFEREIFVRHFLSRVFPPHFRFGSGDIIDQNGNQSGQVDIVVEYPFIPSLPSSHDDSLRLYFAEGVAAVIEVKSNIQNEWGSILEKANKVGNLQRKSGVAQRGDLYGCSLPKIPFYVVGYYGWDKFDTLKEKVKSNSVSGILQINKKWFYALPPDPYFDSRAPDCYADENDCLMGLIYCLQVILSNVQGIWFSPIQYCVKKNSDQI